MKFFDPLQMLTSSKTSIGHLAFRKWKGTNNFTFLSKHCKVNEL